MWQNTRRVTYPVWKTTLISEEQYNKIQHDLFHMNEQANSS